MVHWSKNPEIRKDVITSMKKSILAKGEDWLKNRAVKAVEARNGSSWNKGLPKEQQPKFGKPASQKQVENMRRIGKFGHPAWNVGIKEWSPRLDHIEAARALSRDGFKCTSCKSSEDLAVHHLRHWNQVVDKSKIHDINNLLTLCRSCHLKLHIRQKLALKKEKDTEAI